MGHHYLPQRYLRHFAHEQRIWVFDRANKRSFQSAPKSVANECGLYSEEVEAFLNESVETPTHPIFDKILRREQISDSERAALARYITFMWKRVPRGRKRALGRVPESAEETRQEVMAEIDEGVRSGLIDDVRAASLRRQVEEIIDREKASPSPRLWYDSFEPIGGSQVEQVLQSMNWVFLCSDSQRFFTSDSPVFFFENEGIGRLTSELTFPISDSIALFADWNRTVSDQYVSANSSLVKKINARTVRNSERFVFAKDNEPWMLPFVSKGSWDVPRLSSVIPKSVRRLNADSRIIVPSIVPFRAR
jgi:hypothetical protein